MKSAAPNFLVLLSICLFLVLALEVRGASQESKREFFAKLMEGEIETPAEFDELAAKAKAAGATEQSILEAKLMFSIKTEHLESIPTLLPQLEATLPRWKESDSPFFGDRDEFEGVLHLAKGLMAARNEASDVFEREMKEAIWKDPKLAEVVAEQIIAFREKQRMRAITVPMQLELETSQGGKTTLAKLVEGKKALPKPKKCERKKRCQRPGLSSRGNKHFRNYSGSTPSRVPSSSCPTGRSPSAAIPRIGSWKQP